MSWKAANLLLRVAARCSVGHIENGLMWSSVY